jgi:hypothetical protein
MQYSILTNWKIDRAFKLLRRRSQDNTSNVVKVSFQFLFLSSADLNQLISSLSVTRTNRARVREQGGQEETEGSNADGTSSHSLTCVGTGLGQQPYTVNSFQGPPKSINVEVQEQYTLLQAEWHGTGLNISPASFQQSRRNLPQYVEGPLDKDILSALYQIVR